MSKLSKEQIKSLEKKSFMCAEIQLLCDGYKVSLKERLVKRTLRVLLFIDNTINADHLLDPADHAESKFYRPYVRYYKKSPRSKKREKMDMGICKPDFASFGQALRHINKVCDSVQIVDEAPC